MPSSPSRVLVVEDDKRLLRALAYFLRQKGLEVDEAADGEAGLEKWRARGADLLIIDNSLPNRMGYEICRDLRAENESGQKLPIILISAFMKVLGADGEDEQDDDLVDAFLRKPFQLEQLWQVIGRMRDGDGDGFRRPGAAHRSELSDGALITGDGTDEVDNLPTDGSTYKTPFIDLLARALRFQKTGILTLREENRVRRLYFANGFPGFARSNLITENLLRYLLRIGEIDADTYRRHLSRMQQERWRPGAMLVREGAVSLTRLNRSHRLLVEEILQICINWNTATFEFKHSLVPVEQAVIYDINPFRIVDRWLERHFTSPQLLDRFQFIFDGELAPSDRLPGWRHLVEWAYALDPELEEVALRGGACAQLLDVPDEHRPLRARLLQTLLLMGALELCDPDDRLRRPTERIRRALMRPPAEDGGETSGVPMYFSRPGMSAVSVEQAGASSPDGMSSPGRRPTSSTLDAVVIEPGDRDQEGRSQEQLRRIYDVVLRDYRRVLDQASPFEVLRVSRNDAIDVIRKRYERFERFYRPENFQRLGDNKLYELAIEIRHALARAMAEIEAGMSSSPGLQSVDTEGSFSTAGTHQPTHDPLAQIFFNDGLTYLRIGAFDDAKEHFQRASKLESTNTMFVAYHIWADFLHAGRSSAAAESARSELQRLIDANPQEDSAYHFLAHIHREEGALELAVSYYRKAAELNPDNRSARLFLQRLAN